MPLNFLIISKASELTSEALAFLKMNDQSYFPTPWDDKSWEQVFGRSRERLILLAIDSKESFIGFALFDILPADSFAHLLKLSIDPGFRKKGHSDALMKEAIKRFKQQAIKVIFLEVEQQNENAIKLYQKLGFLTVHKKKQFYSNGATALIMTLDVYQV